MADRSKSSSPSDSDHRYEFDDEKPIEFSELVAAKLCEWSDPKARLEKKKIQKQIVNQHCREWLRDIVMIDPQEVAMIAEDENAAFAMKMDHVRYVRKAVFDEYTFTKKPPVKQIKETQNEYTFNRSILNIERSSKVLLELNDDSSSNGGGGIVRELIKLGIDISESYNDENDVDEFSFPNLTGLSDEINPSVTPLTKDRERNIYLLTRNLVKQALKSSLKRTVLVVVDVLKTGLLYDALLPIVEKMVKKSIKIVKNKVPLNDHKWLDALKQECRGVVQKMDVEVFDEAPFVYFEKLVTKYFIDEYLIPISDSIVKKYVMKNPTIVTTNFKKGEILTYVKRELIRYEDFSVITKIAKHTAKIIADEVTAPFNITLVLPRQGSEPTASEVDLRTKYDKKIEELTKTAEKQARKLVEHLKDPETARKEINKKHVSETKKYVGKKDNCRCAKISKLGGKRKPFLMPYHKVKSNYYFYNKYISDINKNTNPITLYPKKRNTIKLVCDDHWKCIPVPLERELRDIPYRFSYAPPYVVEQIHKTKSIKTTDDPMICNILKNINENRKSEDSNALLKKILGVHPEKRESLQGISAESAGDGQRSSPSPGPADRVNLTDSQSENALKVTESVDKPSFVRQKSTSKSNTLSRLTARSSMSFNPQMQRAQIPKMKTVGKLPEDISRESQIPVAPELPPYHKHLLEGYTYDMIPITPCRFHSLKKINTILKRFETAGGDGALEYHFETPKAPVNVDELLPIPRLVDAFGQWKKYEEENSSPWTRALNDSRLKRMARFRKIFHKDPVFGFMSSWEHPTYKCPGT